MHNAGGLSGSMLLLSMFVFFFFQAEDGIRDLTVTGVQTCALPILLGNYRGIFSCRGIHHSFFSIFRKGVGMRKRSEEHTSELQSQSNLVCRLLLEKKKKISIIRCTFVLIGI